MNFVPSFFAFWSEATFDPFPHGMSIKTYFEPADIFFDIIDAMSCGSISRFSNRSTLIILSSDGASPSEPPHARQALVFATTDFICFRESSTFEIVSITSAVPDAEVIARDDVLGRINPAAAQIATTTGVVRFPAIPPMQCLSAMYFPLNFNFAPVFTIASVKLIVSFVDIPLSFSVATKNAISASVKLLWTISEIRYVISSLVSGSPLIFFLISAVAPDISDALTST